MANKQKGANSILDDLLMPSSGDAGKRTGRIMKKKSRSATGDSDENFYSNMAAVVSDSDISEADPKKVASSIKDLDDMDADLFGDKFSNKPASRRGGGSRSGGTPRTPRTVSPSVRVQTKVTSPGRELSPTGRPSIKDTVPGASDVKSDVQSAAVTLSPPIAKPSSAPGKMTGLFAASERLKPGQRPVQRPKTTPSANSKSFDDFDEDDPLAGLLSDEDLDLSEGGVKNETVTAPADVPDGKDSSGVAETCDADAATGKRMNLTERPPTRNGSDTNNGGHGTVENKPPLLNSINSSKSTKATPKNDVIFSDDEDMLALDGDKPRNADENVKEKSANEVKPARSVLEDLLGKQSVSSLLEKPQPREQKFTLDPKYLKGATGNKNVKEEEEFSFGNYMPSAALSSRPSSRRSVRFEEDDAEKAHDTNRPVSRGSSQSSGGARQRAKVNLDWLIDPDVEMAKVDSHTDGLRSPTADPKEDEFPRHTEKSATDAEDGGVKNKAPPQKKEEKLSNWLGLADESESDNYDWLMAPSSTTPKKEPPKPAQTIEREIEGDVIKKAPIRRQTPVTDPQSLVQPQGQLTDEPSTPAEERHPQHVSDAKHTLSVLPKTFDSRPGDFNKSPNISTNRSDTAMIPSDTPAPTPDISVLPQVDPQQQTQQQQQLRDLQQQQMQHLQDQILKQQEEMQQEDQKARLRLQQQQLQGMISHLQQQMQANITTQQSSPSLLPRSLLPKHTSILHDPQYKNMDLEMKVRKLEIEIECQESLTDSTRRRYEEELVAVETSYKNRLKISEDNYRAQEIRWKEERSEMMTEHSDKMRKCEGDKMDAISQLNKKLAEAEACRLADIDRLNDAHRKYVEDLKTQHSDTVERLKNIKNTEVQSVLDANSTTKSMQAVIDQMSSSARDIGQLQYKMDQRNRTELDEREIHLRARDDQLSNLREQLEKQQNEMAVERSRLQQLVASLEKQLVEQNHQMEQERWRVRQDEAKLQAVRAADDEERRRWQETQAREKAAMSKAKDDLIEEQKSTLTQLFEERKTMADERSELEIQKKILREKEQEQTIKYIKVQAEMESVMKASEQERARISARARDLEKEEAMFGAEWERLHKARTDLDLDREHLGKLSADVDAKSQRVNDMLEMANQRRSEGDNLCSSAKQIQSEQTMKSKQIDQRMFELQEKEKMATQERLNLSKERDDIEKIKDSLLCVNCRTPVRDTDPHNFIGSTSAPMSANTAQLPGLKSAQKIAASIDADRSVRLWKIRAQKDKMFLQDETLFLENLKHSPYH